MKKSISILIVFVLLVVSSGVTHGQIISKEEAAVIAVVEAENHAFAKRNYDAWQKTWLHDESVSHVVASHNYHHELHGWTKVNSMIGNIIKNNQTSTNQSVKKNYQVRISMNLATVSYDGYSQDNNGKLSKIQEKGFRTLVKKDGQWKIAQVIGTMPASYSE